MRVPVIFLVVSVAPATFASGLLGLQVAVSAEVPVERDWSSFGMAMATPPGFLDADPSVVVPAESPFWSELMPVPMSDRLLGDVTSAASAWSLGDWASAGGSQPMSDWSFSTAPVAPVAPPVAPIQPEPRRD
jgi:hypothetical protein